MKLAVSALAIAVASLTLASCASSGASFPGGGASAMRYDPFYDGVHAAYYPGDWGGDGDLPYVNRLVHLHFHGTGLLGRGRGSQRHGGDDKAH